MVGTEMVGFTTTGMVVITDHIGVTDFTVATMADFTETAGTMVIMEMVGMVVAEMW
jgi:hypothetical protein